MTNTEDIRCDCALLFNLDDRSNDGELITLLRTWTDYTRSSWPYYQRRSLLGSLAIYSSAPHLSVTCIFLQPNEFLVVLFHFDFLEAAHFDLIFDKHCHRNDTSRRSLTTHLYCHRTIRPEY